MGFIKNNLDPVKSSRAFLRLIELNKQALIDKSKPINVTKDQLNRCQNNFLRLIKEVATFDHANVNILLIVNDLASGRDFYFNRDVIYFPDEDQINTLLSRHKSTYPKWLN